MENAKPTFVLISPYKYRHSKWVEPLTKHFSLFLAILMFTGVVITYQYSNYPNHWINHLPTTIIYSLIYLFGRNSTNKTFLALQIHASYCFIIINLWFWTSFYPTEVSALFIIIPLTLIETYSLLFYTFLLEITHRRQYTKDLSTAKAIAELNERDFYYNLHFMMYPTFLMSSVHVLHYCTTWHTWSLDTFWSDCSTFQLAYFALGVCISCFGIIYLCRCYYVIGNENFQNVSDTRKRTQYDSDGRAWFCMVPATEDELMDGEWDIFGVEKKSSGCGFNVCKLFSWKRNNVKFVNVATPALKN